MIDKRLLEQKNYPRAMRSYVMMLYEFVLELKPEKVLEIGVHVGQSTKTILMALEKNKKGTLVSIDRKRRSPLSPGYLDLASRFHLIRGSSHDERVFEVVKNILKDNELYNILFIDGDHSYDGVKQDWENYTPMVKPGGLIILHDVTNRNVGIKDFWKEITWDKFVFDWGRARSRVIPGLGIIKKPYESKK